jgi:sugar O-acyltransferase (sialic acid O-acetyltransferase NeuD family)
MEQIVIIGAGAHGRDIAESLSHPTQKKQKLLGFVDDKPELKAKLIDGFPVLGNWSWFEENDSSQVKVICASGFSEPRKKMVERAEKMNLSFANVISPLAYLATDVKIGVGNFIGHGVIICRGCQIKNHAIINYGSQVSHDNCLENFVSINPNVNLAGNISIGEGAYIGIGTSIIQGIKIGNWTIIGAGAAVIRDLPNNVTAVGVPAKVIKTRK